MSFADASTTDPEHRGRFFPDSPPAENGETVSSPVPLSQEESENAEVRALAAKLAPTLIEVDHTLTSANLSFSTDNNNQAAASMDDYDDDIAEEVRNLQQSEELMRQELEMAMDFDNFMKFTTGADDETTEETFYIPTGSLQTPPRAFSNRRQQQQQQVAFEADVDEGPGAEEKCDEARTTTPLLEPIQIPSPDHSYLQPVTPKLPPPRTPDYNERNAGQEAGGFWIPSSMNLGSSSSITSSSTTQQAPRYRHKEHMEALKLTRELRGCWYSVDMTAHLQTKVPPEAGPVVQEYCLAIPEAKLKQVFVGFTENHAAAATAATTAAPPPCLPVRTLTIRIRPDVLCGAVMEGVHSAICTMNADIQKRQGGHLQAELEGYWVDFLLATEKSELQECARKLIVRVYRQRSALPATSEDSKNADEDQLQGDEEEAFFVDGMETLNTSQTTALHLRECCALIQRMEAPAHARKMLPMPANPHSMQQAVSDHLLEQYRACPSVRDGRITLPSLNADDFAVIRKSWPLVEAVWEELDTRDLAYSTLEVAHFGAFPALPTLDVHYCSQLRRISREEMVGQLLKSASELEDYARQAEYSCASMISVLKPSFDAYEEEELDLPEAIPLSTYPLDYTAPQVTCPPWGLKVQHALNEIPAWNDEPLPDTENKSLHSFQLAKKAVAVVLQAFSKQDDEEQSARLQRKNAQVMDRLDRMLSYEKKLVAALATCTTSKAAKAAADFYAKSSVRAVPLLKWNIVAGGGAGTVSVTSSHIMFATQMIPVVGEVTVKIFDLAEVDFSVCEATPSLLKPFPTTVSVKDRSGNEVYSFRLSSGGNRLKSLLSRLRDNPLLLDIPSYPG